MKIFEDMFSSHRGAGVIGTFVSVGVLLALGFLFILVFDEDFQGGDQTLESVIRNQDNAIKQLHASITVGKKSLSEVAKNQATIDEINSVSRKIESRVIRSNETKHNIAALRTSLDKMVSVRASYLADYRRAIRHKEIGKTYSEVITQSGRSYKNVTIKKIDDLRVGVSHDGGSGIIIWSDLPDDMIDRLQFSKELADQQVKSEQKAATHFSTAAEESDIKSRIAYVKEKIAKATGDFESQKTITSQCESKIKKYENEIQQLQEMIADENKKDGLRQTPRYKNQIDICEKNILIEKNRITNFAKVQESYDILIRELNSQIELLNLKLIKIPK